jgi:hypothetical protein
MIYVTIAPDPTRKKQVMECKKVAFALSSSLLRDLRAASPDGQIRNGLIEDAISEGWMRWQDGAPRLFKHYECTDTYARAPS